MKEFFVEIVKFDGDEVVNRMGPMGERVVEKVESGALINLNYEDYFVRTVSEEKNGG